MKYRDYLHNTPIDGSELFRYARKIRKELHNDQNIPVKIAILGGSTTSTIKILLELFLLDRGITPTFYESGYNRIYEEACFSTKELVDFKPDIIYIHSCMENLCSLPEISDSESEVESKLKKEEKHLAEIWSGLQKTLKTVIIQSNFFVMDYADYGQQDRICTTGIRRYIQQVNQIVDRHAIEKSWLYLFDLEALTAKIGIRQCFSRRDWYQYRQLIALPWQGEIAQALASSIAQLYGKTTKCIILDLDNTLWGGIIGDDGLSGITIGPDTPAGEAYFQFQKYLQRLKERGLLLAICSKNDKKNAIEGLNHPNNCLHEEDFAIIKADWTPKNIAVKEIATALNLSMDSMIFIDDNPAERALIRESYPDIRVPEIGDDPTRYIEILEQSHLFEYQIATAEDLQRTGFYQQESARQELQKQSMNYEEYLTSLQMQAFIHPFQELEIDRITQLSQRTNQFNLTTRCYQKEEISYITKSVQYLTLSGRLTDRFGDNGLVSAMIGKIDSKQLYIELWIMSCRVFGRQFEYLMFEELLNLCRKAGITAITGKYIPSAKNNPVKDLYQTLGFHSEDGHMIYDMSKPLEKKCTIIERITHENN